MEVEVTAARLRAVTRGPPGKPGTLPRSGRVIPTFMPSVAPHAHSSVASGVDIFRRGEGFIP